MDERSSGPSHNGPMTDQQIEHIYLQHRIAFQSWAYRKFGLNAHAALDVYQEAVVVFVRNVRNGRFDPAACEPATYLYAIGRNMALKHVRDRKDHLNADDPEVDIDPIPPEVEAVLKDQHEQHLIRSGMARLTEREQEILRLYYHENRSMEEIARIMGYKNADVAKKMKHQSFRKLAGLLANVALSLLAIYVD